jgi:hypothetical protein
MNDLIYNIDRKRGTIECIVENCKTDFMRITDKILSQYPERLRYFYNFIAFYHCEALIKDSYSGKSVCSTHDVFDEKYGKDVARTKAIIKREVSFDRALEAIYADIDSLGEINVQIDRENVLFKHLANLDALLASEVSLAKIRGYAKDDENDVCDINDNIDINKNSTPHCCSLCEGTFLNYTDDEAYMDNEYMWWNFEVSPGKVVEVCPNCMSALKKLSN